MKIRGPARRAQKPSIQEEQTWISTTTWHLFSGSRNLTEGISVRAHVCQDDQHVLATLICQVLGCGEGNTRSNDTLNGGIVGQIEEEACLVHGPILLKILQLTGAVSERTLQYITLYGAVTQTPHKGQSTARTKGVNLHALLPVQASIQASRIPYVARLDRLTGGLHVRSQCYAAPG